MGGCEVESAMVLFGRFPQSQLLSVECVDIRKKNEDWKTAKEMRVICYLGTNTNMGRSQHTEEGKIGDFESPPSLQVALMGFM